MPRFFAEVPPSAETVKLFGEDARHIGRSLRMAVGEKITVCRDGVDYICKLSKISDSEVVAEILSESPSKEPSIQLTLYQALPKSDKLETIVQKSVELGVSHIVPVITKRCISRPDQKQFAKKIERLQKIALEAAKQSGRGIIPEVSEIITFERCLNDMTLPDSGLPLICYEKEGGKRLSQIDFSNVHNISLLIGPEGGFDPSETDKAINAGVIPIWLGNRILRCETAPIAASAIIMSLTGNM